MARSKNQVPIRLTEERWLHIVTSHTEMNGNILELIKTIEDPETITKGVSDELRCIRFFPHTHYISGLLAMRDCRGRDRRCFKPMLG